MKFSTQEDMELPIAEAFAMLCDVAHYERMAQARGADLARVGNWSEPVQGSRWTAAVDLRGKTRRFELEIARLDAPDEMVLEMSSKGLTGTVGVELIALSRSRTRMVVGFELRPVSLPAKLLVQSMKLSKSTLTEKFKKRVAAYVAEMEERHRRGA